MFFSLDGTWLLLNSLNYVREGDHVNRPLAFFGNRLRFFVEDALWVESQKMRRGELEERGDRAP